MPKGEPTTSPSVLIKFGRGVVRARKQVGISQEELALKCDIDRSYLGTIERGEHSTGLLHIARIASALDMKISELMETAKI